jgi:hypothetical protein
MFCIHKLLEEPAEMDTANTHRHISRWSTRLRSNLGAYIHYKHHPSTA